MIQALTVLIVHDDRRVSAWLATKLEGKADVSVANTFDEAKAMLTTNPLGVARATLVRPAFQAVMCLALIGVCALGLLGAARSYQQRQVGALVASGDAEIGFQQLSELLPISGIEVVGPLPAEVQRVTTFSAGIVRGSKHPELARELLDFYRLPSASATIKSTGLEPIVIR